MSAYCLFAYLPIDRIVSYRIFYRSAPMFLPHGIFSILDSRCAPLQVQAEQQRRELSALSGDLSEALHRNDTLLNDLSSRDLRIELLQSQNLVRSPLPYPSPPPICPSNSKSSSSLHLSSSFSSHSSYPSILLPHSSFLLLLSAS